MPARKSTHGWRTLWFAGEDAKNKSAEIHASLAMRLRQPMRGGRVAKYDPGKVSPGADAGVRPGFDPVLAAEITAMRRRLKRDASSSLNPSSTYMRVWDFVTCLCLVITAVVTPVEVGFSSTEGARSPRTFLFWLNRFVDVVFIKDIFIQFFLAYTDEHRGSLLIRSRSAIARRYLKSWFLIDVASSALAAGPDPWGESATDAPLASPRV